MISGVTPPTYSDVIVLHQQGHSQAHTHAHNAVAMSWLTSTAHRNYSRRSRPHRVCKGAARETGRSSSSRGSRPGYNTHWRRCRALACSLANNPTRSTACTTDNTISVLVGGKFKLVCHKSFARAPHTHLSSGGSSLGCSPTRRSILLATGSLIP